MVCDFIYMSVQIFLLYIHIGLALTMTVFLVIAGICLFAARGSTSETVCWSCLKCR